MTYVIKNQLAYFHSTEDKCQNYSNKLMNIHTAHEIREPNIHSAESLVPEWSFNKRAQSISQQSKQH
jgi:hypothetical protein